MVYGGEGMVCNALKRGMSWSGLGTVRIVRIIVEGGEVGTYDAMLRASIAYLAWRERSRSS